MATEDYTRLNNRSGSFNGSGDEEGKQEGEKSRFLIYCLEERFVY